MYLIAPANVIMLSCYHAPAPPSHLIWQNSEMIFFSGRLNAGETPATMCVKNTLKLDETSYTALDGRFNERVRVRGRSPCPTVVASLQVEDTLSSLGSVTEFRHSERARALARVGVMLALIAKSCNWRPHPRTCSEFTKEGLTSVIRKRKSFDFGADPRTSSWTGLLDPGLWTRSGPDPVGVGVMRWVGP